MSKPLPSLKDIPSCADLGIVGVAVPDWLSELEAAFGHSASRRLLLAFAGRELNIPSGDVRGTALDRACGPRVARWLQEHLGHGRFRVPMALASLTARRRVVIHAQLAAGRSLEETAAAAQCHTRTVSALKAQFRAEGLLPERGTP